MRPHLLLWSMRAALLTSAVFSSRYLWDSARAPEGWPRRQALAEEVANVSHDIASLDAQVRAIQRQIIAERDRPAVQESLVRDFLGYVRPTDVVMQAPPR